MPEYPALLQDRAVEGEVKLRLRVNSSGKVEDCTVVEATEQAFADAILATVNDWQFSPARKDGVAVARNVSIAIPFYINNRAASLPVMDNGQPELLGLVRPAHPGKGAASATVKIRVSPNAMVADISLLSSEGVIEAIQIVDAVSRWSFAPSRSEYGPGLPALVLAKITFTSSGNVLVQYPYPPPKVSLSEDSQPAAPQQ